jgi:hypothetical protein
VHPSNVTSQLLRLGWFVRASIVEIKLRQLARAVKANFDRNQPRAPGGNPGGGQWTGTGGSARTGSSPRDDNRQQTTDRPEIPEERSSTARLRNRVVVAVAR